MELMLIKYCTIALAYMYLQLVCVNSDSNHLKWGTLQCSAKDMQALQSHWRWFMLESTLSEKISIYTAVMEYLIAQHSFTSSTAQDLTAEQSQSVVPDKVDPLPLRAYRMLSDIDLVINSYTSPDVYASHTLHLAVTQTELMQMYIDNMELLYATVEIVGRIILTPTEKITWTVCMTDMGRANRRIFASVLLTARCDVIESRDHQIRGFVNFTQPAVGGKTQIGFDLTGFKHPNRRYSLHLHNSSGSHVDRLLVHVVKTDSSRKVLSNVFSENISLFGSNKIIKKTIVIELLEDGVRQAAPRTRDSDSVATCVIQQTYN